MNTALIIERFDPEGGGAERSALQVARELATRGHKVTVLAGWCPQEVAVDGLVIERCPVGRVKTALDLWWFSRWAQRRLARGGFDASLSLTTTVPAAVMQPRSGTIVETLRRNVAMRESTLGKILKKTLIRLSPKQTVLLSLEKQAIRNPGVRRFAAVSRYVAKQLVNHYKVPSERIEVIPNGAEVPAVSATQRADWRRRIREEFDIPQDMVVYLFAAHNPRLKGIDTLFAAARRLRNWREDYCLMLAGPIAYEHQRTAERLGIRPRIRFIGPTQRMPELYCAADITVLPTYYDPSSKVVIESLMLGTPAISTLYNGASDFIIGEVGRPRGMVIAEPDDVEALAVAMVDLAEPARLQRAREATAGLAEELSMHRHVDKLETLLKHAANGK